MEFSSFHVIGEIFDKVCSEGSLGMSRGPTNGCPSSAALENAGSDFYFVAPGGAAKS
jgi:hypothetical protein